MDLPKLLAKAWALTGLKNDIPDDRSSTLSDERATYSDGFPQITMTPIAQGGKAPSGKDMNGVLNEITSHIVFQNKGGNYLFNQEFANKIGGYSKGAVLINNNYTAFFISLVDNNLTNFNTVSYAGYWEIIATTDINDWVKPKTITSSTNNTVDNTGHTHNIDKASTSKSGIVQLTNALDSDSETLGLTAKAGKALKALINALTSNLQNYIPNSKKSNSVTSTSSDTVATSYAAKTAYDKGVEAKNRADRAYTLAQAKQSPATTLAGYGITDFAQRRLTASDNLNDITVKGIYHNSTYLNTPNNNYPEEVSGVLIVLSAAEQVYFASNGKMFKRLKSNNNWANGWVRLDNLTTLIGANQNLDEITTDGNYYIVGTSRATLAKNYPVEGGDGALEVFGNGYFQRFTTFHSRQVFIRRKINNAWTEWLSIDGLNKASRVGDEIKMKTIDFNKADGYTYSGFYRPNGNRLNNLPLDGLMMHITHPEYTTNAHARGIGFSYGGYNGKQAWDIFTTAFDANGNYLGKKQILTELHRSDFVTSASSKTVATSAAVKTTYDKAVDAYIRAETAESNAKAASLPITGGNLTGNLIVPSIDIQSKYVNVYPKNGDYGGLRIYRTGNQGEWGSHLEALPDKRWKFWTQNGYEVYVPAKSGTLAIDHEVVHKSGDIMKWLSIENTQAWLTVKSTGKETTGLDFINWNGQYPQVTLSAVDIGGYANELRIYTTPTGSDYNSDRRLHAMTVGVNGEIWTNAYGHLHNYFVKKSDFYEMSYNQHYGGAHVWAIRFNQAGGIKRIQIHCTNMYSNGELDIYLPEEVSGIRSISVQDDGYLRYSYGVKVMSANLIKVYTPPKVTTGFYVNIVGWHDF